MQPLPEPSPRQIYLLQGKATKVGAGLGKTTRWAHRKGLIMKGVKMIEGLNKPYHLIGEADVAAKLEAKRAIDQGTRLCAEI